MTWERRPVAALAAIAVAVAITSGCDKAAPAPASPSDRLAIGDAQHFLDMYVDPSGRVVRRDQGGDTVSEGQGYALLLAEATGERTRFSVVWRWTEQHLQQPDGLFAYLWSGGQVTSTTPAADADVQIAWALDLAGQRWHVASYRAAAKRIAVAVADHEVGYDTAGRPTLAAGPWAVPAGQPVTVEPGYWTFPADTDLARLTGDNRWRDLAAADLAHLERLVHDGSLLPADWATVGNDAVTPVPPPNATGSAVGSGQDGLRTLVWAGCTAAGRRLDARWWSLVSGTARSGALSRSLDGQPTSQDQTPLGDVAAAAAANGAGATTTRNQLLAAADAVARRYPTYYGTAWAALGRVLLTTHLLSGCD